MFADDVSITTTDNDSKVCETLLQKDLELLIHSHFK